MGLTIPCHFSIMQSYVRAQMQLYVAVNIEIPRMPGRQLHFQNCVHRDQSLAEARNFHKEHAGDRFLCYFNVFFAI